jgi:hypothetical protein
MVSLFITAGDLVPLLFSNRYLASVPVLRVGLLVMAAHVFAPDVLLRALGRTGTLAFGSSAALIAGAGLVCVGLRALGLPGAAAGSVLAVYGLKTYYAWEVRRSAGKEAGALLPWASLLRIAGIAALAGMPAAAMTWLLPAGLARLAAALLAYGITYLLVMTASRTWTHGDQELIRRWLSLRFFIGRSSE